MRAYLIVLVVAIGCGGEDEGGSTVKPPPGAPNPKAPAAAKGKGKQLTPMKRIEDRVTCPAPSDAKKCDPKAPTCGQGQYCIAAGAKDFFCGPCPERDAIRHVFKPRDFQGADLRDPFQSFVIVQPGLNTVAGADKTPIEQTPKCTRKDQFQAGSFNFQQLKLVGIVAQGTQRKVLVMGGNQGYILKKGDCVGKEKAVVKDVGAGFVTFQVDPSGKGDAVDYSMQLYPQLSMNTPDAIDPGAASTPMVAPPSQITPVAPPAQPDAPKTTTTIIQDKPAGGGGTTTIPPPPQAPTQLKP